MHWGLLRRQKESDDSSVNTLSCDLRQWQACTIGQKGQGGNSQELGRIIRHEGKASDQKRGESYISN